MRGRAVPEGPSMPPGMGWKVWRVCLLPHTPRGLQDTEEVGQEMMYKIFLFGGGGVLMGEWWQSS